MMDQVFIFCAQYLYFLVFLIAGIFFLRQKRAIQIRMIIFGSLSAIISYIISVIAGKLYFDPRPFVEGHFTPLIAHDTENGFPSDHVLLVSCVAAVMTVFNKKLAAILWFLTIIVAISRVWVGVHHYIDVTASILISILVTSILYSFLKKRLSTIESKSGRQNK
jgi:undecaprenyl-diphosphatase